MHDQTGRVKRQKTPGGHLVYGYCTHAWPKTNIGEKGQSGASCTWCVVGYKINHFGRDVDSSQMTWTRVRLESPFLWLVTWLATSRIDLGLDLDLLSMTWDLTWDLLKWLLDNASQKLLKVCNKTNLKIESQWINNKPVHCSISTWHAVNVWLDLKSNHSDLTWLALGSDLTWLDSRIGCDLTWLDLQLPALTWDLTWDLLSVTWDLTWTCKKWLAYISAFWSKRVQCKNLLLPIS